MSRLAGPPCRICGGKNMAKGLCAHHYLAEYRQANLQKLADLNKVWRDSNREVVRAKARARYRRDKERRAAKAIEYRKATAEQNRARARAWAAANPERRKERAKIDGARRRSGIGRATPPWAERKVIAAVYEGCARLSAVLGVPYEVDHIYPLNGGKVCGLHVLANLQILPERVNRLKSNNFVP